MNTNHCRFSTHVLLLSILNTLHYTLFCSSLSPTVSGGGDPSLNCSSQGVLNFFSCIEFFWEFFLVFLEGLGWLRASSMGACEALCDMLACKNGYTNTFWFDYQHTGTKPYLQHCPPALPYKRLVGAGTAQNVMFCSVSLYGSIESIVHLSSLFVIFLNTVVNSNYCHLSTSVQMLHLFLWLLVNKKNISLNTVWWLIFWHWIAHSPLHVTLKA